MVRASVRPRVLLAYLTCCVLWGSTWMAAKVGLADLPPLRFAALRFALAFVLLTPFAWRARPTGLGAREWRFIAAVGVLNLAVPHGLMFIAQRQLSSGMAAVFFATFPLWMVGLGWFLLPGQRSPLWKLDSAPIGLAGIGVIQSNAFQGEWWAPGPLLGGLLVVSAAILIALAGVLLKRETRPLSPVLVVWGQVAVAMGALGLAAVVFEPAEVSHWSARSVGALVYLAAFGTVGTYLTFFWVLPQVSLAAVGAIPLLDTLVAVSLGTVVLKEPLTLRLALGAGLVLVAAALANAPERRD